MTIYYHPRFQRSYKRLDPQIRLTAEKRIALFRKDALDQRLGAHRLHGKLKSLWSFSIDSRYLATIRWCSPPVACSNTGTPVR
jgi:mRNA-degrading endonuclease YafQ of YafQ-DinJ toxin-antitoxin module